MSVILAGCYPRGSWVVKKTQRNLLYVGTYIGTIVTFRARSFGVDRGSGGTAELFWALKSGPMACDPPRG